MRVEIEEIKAHLKRRAEINSMSLDEIEFYENGKRVDIDKSIIDEFMFVGLSNVDFIATGFYLTGFDA